MEPKNNHNSNNTVHSLVTDHRNKYNNHEEFEILQDLLKCGTETLSEKCCWKNSLWRLAQHRVTTNLQFLKTAVSAKCNKLKHNKARYSCIRK